MHTKNDKRLLAKDGICLITHPSLALTLGKSEAIFLQQLHYWLTTDTQIGTILGGQRWIYNSYKSWTQNLQIYSDSTIRRAIRKLEALGVIISKNLNKKKSDHTKWYTIDYEALRDLIPGLSTKPQGREDKPQEEPQGNRTPLTVPEALGDDRLVILTKPCGQNDHIITKENRKDFREEISSGEGEGLTQSSQASLEKDIFQKMMVIWNEVVEEGKRTLELTQKRALFLITAFKTKFEGSLERWKEFCKRVASSKFLMGEIKASFRASLDWVLKFDVMQRILEGDFGIGDRTVYTRDENHTTENLQTEIQTSSDPEPIKHIRQGLLTNLGHAAYVSWIKETIITTKEGRVTLKTHSPFAKDSINRLFLTSLEKVCQTIIQGVEVRVE